MRKPHRAQVWLRLRKKGRKRTLGRRKTTLGRRKRTLGRGKRTLGRGKRTLGRRKRTLTGNMPRPGIEPGTFRSSV